jgi:AraC-like DNA-binding protein
LASRACGIERNHLNVRLRRATGLTFHRFLTRRRLLRAVELLHATDRDLLAIALDSGFGSLSGFERNFARAFGTPPSRYRDLVRRTRFPPSPAGRGGHAARLPLFS